MPSKVKKQEDDINDPLQQSTIYDEAGQTYIVGREDEISPFRSVLTHNND